MRTLQRVGAGLFALARSGAFTRQAREVVNEAKARASELPEELVGRVHEATGSARNGRRTAGSSGTSSGSRRRKAASSR